jgi:hypothetical protein
MAAMRLLAAILVLQVLLAGTLIALVATDNVPFVGSAGLEGGDADAATTVPAPRTSAFDGRAAYASVRRQVALGPRPAGSAASRVLAERLRRTLPAGRFQAVPGGLRNVVGVVPGRDRRRVVVVGAHYDTKDIPGFVGANDGAGGIAVLTGLAHRTRPGRLRSTVVFVAFDGEESPAGTPDSQFEQAGLRGGPPLRQRTGHDPARLRGPARTAPAPRRKLGRGPLVPPAGRRPARRCGPRLSRRDPGGDLRRPHPLRGPRRARRGPHRLRLSVLAPAL